VVVELFRIRPPDLVIMDAILAMEGYGPASPETRWVNKILASNNAVALDTVEAKIIGFNVEDVPMLTIARELGLGPTYLKDIEIIGDAFPIKEYHRPDPPESTYSYKAGVGGGRTSIEFYRQRVAYRPVINAEKCFRECRACIDACPSGALARRSSEAPVVDSARCMLCSACKEACEHMAIELIPDEKLMGALAETETDGRPSLPSGQAIPSNRD